METKNRYELKAEEDKIYGELCRIQKEGPFGKILTWRGAFAVAVGGALIAESMKALMPSDKGDRQKLEAVVRTENVVGNEALDRFVDKDGQRLYLEIDGKPAIEYFKNQ